MLFGKVKNDDNTKHRRLMRSISLDDNLRNKSETPKAVSHFKVWQQTPNYVYLVTVSTKSY